MFAVIETGGKQYRVSPGQTIRVEKLSTSPGAVHQFDRVLLLQEDGGATHVGQPAVDNAYVVGQVTGLKKGKKVVVFKFKRRKNHHKKTGHRQTYTELLIRALGIGEISPELLAELEQDAADAVVAEVDEEAYNEMADDEDLDEEDLDEDEVVDEDDDDLDDDDEDDTK